MKISSPDFGNNQSIPTQYTCDGEGMAPTIEFSDVPESSKSFALTVKDPDALNGTFTHWLIYNIPANTRKIEEGNVPPNSLVGRNSAGGEGYTPPCPPSGSHRYVFRLYALDAILELNAGISLEALEDEMQGQVLEEAELIGVYEKTSEK